MSSPDVVPFLARPESVPLEAWDSGAAPGVSWRTLISSDRTPTNELSTGVCFIEPGGELSRHHHAQAEVYHFISGACRVQVNEELFAVNAGDTVFVPGHAWHSVTNEGSQRVQLFYCFATTSFDEVLYHYPDGSTWKV